MTGPQSKTEAAADGLRETPAQSSPPATETRGPEATGPNQSAAEPSPQPGAVNHPPRKREDESGAPPPPATTMPPVQPPTETEQPTTPPATNPPATTPPATTDTEAKVPPQPVPAPAAPATPSQPAPAKPNATGGGASEDRCITSLKGVKKRDLDLVRPLFHDGAIQTNWESRGGIKFTLRSDGNMQVIITGLTAKQKKALAKQSKIPNLFGGVRQATVEDVDAVLTKGGGLPFDAKLCLKDGKLEMPLVGVGIASGKKGNVKLTYLTTGARVQGSLAGFTLNEDFRHIDGGAAPAAR